MVTKSDIARALGLSHTCISQVLNQAPNSRISERTRRRVIDQARAMGYVPDRRRRSPAGSAAIAYFLCDVRHPDVWYLKQISAFQQLALTDDRQTALFVVGRDLRSLQDALRVLELNPPLGVVLDGLIPDSLLRVLQERKIPCVAYGDTRYAADPKLADVVNTVTLGMPAGVRELMERFHEKGARRISLSIGPLDILCHEQILTAYKQSIEKLHLPYDPALVQIGEETSGEQIVQRLGQLGVRYDAMILGSPARAIRALPCLRPQNRDLRHDCLVAVLGMIECAAELPDDVIVCGARVSDIADALYRTIAAEINYRTGAKRHVVVPCGLHIGTGIHLD